MTAETQLAGESPKRHWKFGRYTLGRYTRDYPVPGARGRWSLDDGCVGVGNCRTPLHAWFALRRWAREAKDLPSADD